MRKGFSKVLAVFLTLMVMCGLAAVGWYFLDRSWQQNKKDLQSRQDDLTRQLGSLRQSSGGNADSQNDQSNSGQNNFLTYTSTDYHYSFQYPKPFYLVDWMWNGNSNARIPSKGRIVWVDKKAIGESAIPMDADPLSAYFSISASVEEYGLSAIRGDGSGITISDETISGEPAWKVVTTVKDEFSDQYTTTYYVNYQSRGYALRIVNSDAAGTHDAEIDAMVKSFQFN